jgi:hypothetical protein
MRVILMNLLYIICLYSYREEKPWMTREGWSVCDEEDWREE